MSTAGRSSGCRAMSPIPPTRTLATAIPVLALLPPSLPPTLLPRHQLQRLSWCQHQQWSSAHAADEHSASARRQWNVNTNDGDDGDNGVRSTTRRPSTIRSTSRIGLATQDMLNQQQENINLQDTLNTQNFNDTENMINTQNEFNMMNP